MNMEQQQEIRSHQFIFVGGLHRSGTSLIYKVLGTDPKISIFSGAGVIEDEGQFLQNVYLPDAAHGGPGAFAFDPDAHLTETSALVTEARNRLVDNWKPYWNVMKPILAEKSPANLIRSRFLQAVFPGAVFIFVIRHPIAVTMATSKWTGAYMRQLIAHWCKAHTILMEDIEYLDRFLILKYEDVLDRPEMVQHEIAKLLGQDIKLAWPDIKNDINKKYFDRWKIGDYHLKSSFSDIKREVKRIRNHLEKQILFIKYEEIIQKYGYTFRI